VSCRCPIAPDPFGGHTFLERCHCVPQIIGSALDVVGCGRAPIGMPQNASYHQVGHAKPMQVASQSAGGQRATRAIREGANHI
jgi:hypothetical protein